MPSQTSPDQLVFPVTGDTMSPRTAITQLADSTQAALNNIHGGLPSPGQTMGRQVNFYGLVAEGPASGTVPGAKQGDTYRESDGFKRLWIYDGANWVTNENGMYLIRPIYVTNGTVGSNGHITPTGACSVDGVFTSRFKRYVIKFDLRFSVASGPYLTLRAGGVDYAGANYNQRGVAQSGASIVTNNGDALNLWSLAAPDAVSTFGSVELSSLAGGTNQQKKLIGDVGLASPIGFHRMTGVLAGVDANTYDGFTIKPKTGILDATYANDIVIYGIV